MVTEFGFFDKLGPLRYSENEEEIFLGRSVTQHKNVSGATAKLIAELHVLAEGLEEFETSSAGEIRKVIRGEKIVRDIGGPVEILPLPTPGTGSVTVGCLRC